MKLGSGKFLYSDKVDLIESTVYPLLNVAVKRFNADMVTSVPGFTNIGSITRFWCISNLYSPRFPIENPSNKLTFHGNITDFTD
ncbi:MAG: hypothetical protein QOK61_08645 [Nitrososphaeraceae archaeon]|nr:hypothetical protein [Nitrososphaeraceae archaeon]